MVEKKMDASKLVKILQQYEETIKGVEILVGRFEWPQENEGENQ